MFEVWIDILKKKKDSILWLLKDNDFSEINLKKFLLEKGIGPDRIIFADRLPLNKHLGRLKFVDLFLDTYPYNAHTTCNAMHHAQKQARFGLVNCQQKIKQDGRAAKEMTRFQSYIFLVACR